MDERSSLGYIPKAPFVHIPHAPRPKISSERTSNQRAQDKPPIGLPVASTKMREHGQETHDASPPQHSPAHNERSLAMPPLLFPFPALPVEYRGSEVLQHLHISIRKCQNRQPRLPGLCLNRPGRQSFGRGLNLSASNDFRCSPQRAITQRRIPAAQINAANNLCIEKPLAPLRRRLLGFENKLVEAGCAGK